MAAILVSGRSLAARKGRCFHFRQKSGSVRITGPDRLCTLDIGVESTAWDRQDPGSFLQSEHQLSNCCENCSASCVEY
jgi:hypothetical protein